MNTNKKQTAMQELINYKNNLIEEQGDQLTAYQVLNLVMQKAEELQEVEKEQIIDSHIEIMKQGLIEEGERKWDEGYLPKIKKQAEEYYKETYEA